MIKRMMTTATNLFIPALALVLSFGLTACSSGDEPSADNAGGGGAASGESTSERAHRMVEDGATLLDVRTPGEFSGGHVDGAVNIPLQALASRMSEIPTDQAVVVYCLSGGRSARAASELESHDYEVLDLGAMTNWDR